MATILITGGTGTIGTGLTSLLLNRGYEVIILTREIPKNINTTSGLSFALWDIENNQLDSVALKKADYIIHLAGAGVAEKRWDDKRKAEIVNSRINSSALIVKALSENKNKVKAVISASAIGWYGADTPSSKINGFSETDIPDKQFLGETCKLWEESIQPVIKQGKRLVILRTGIVLSIKGGALVEFIKPLSFGLATILGNGKQIISWIHKNDLYNIYLLALENENMEGVFNAVAPNPISNKRFVLLLAKISNGIMFLPFYVPAFLLKLIMGEMSIEVLKSATVSCTKIVAQGFQFQFTTLEAALKDIIKKK